MALHTASAAGLVALFTALAPAGASPPSPRASALAAVRAAGAAPLARQRRSGRGARLQFATGGAGCMVGSPPALEPRKARHALPRQPAGPCSTGGPLKAFAHPPGVERERGDHGFDRREKRDNNWFADTITAPADGAVPANSCPPAPGDARTRCRGLVCGAHRSLARREARAARDCTHR